MIDSSVVFIDTQYFVKSQFNFGSRAFISFRKLCSQSKVRYLMTSVVEREVEAKIAVSIKEALSSLKSFSKKASILSTIDDPHLSSLFINVPESEVYQKASAVFHKYNKECQYEYVESDQVDPEELLELYFENKPPFSEKKKKEFPDAISLLSLESHLEEGEKVFIISEDPDMKSYCAANSERFVSMPSLERFLGHYNEQKSTRTERIKSYITDNPFMVEKLILDFISDREVYNNSTWEDAEVDEYKIESYSDFELNVIEMNDIECLFSFDIDVILNVSVTGPDFVNGFFDKEDSHTYTLGNTTRNESVTLKFECELEMSYDYHSGELKDVELGNLYVQHFGSGIEISVEEELTYDGYS
ncbi:PIN domain-containing protein [uncultured Vibrio sp.]|uniref:PIN domain-containing protein n=1 Tax=uncultured Vibrio sp. TaxID=114054 RepID=UPI0025F79C59|nr:PIN domain-containing protein [uncultured Vibrio sp.]